MMMNILLQSSLPFLPSVRVAETYVAVRIFYWGVAPCLWSVSLSFDHRSGCECADACLSRTTFHTKSCTITVVKVRSNYSTPTSSVGVIIVSININDDMHLLHPGN